jgi:hypothetical protein
MEQIDEAARSILERTGIKIDSFDALALLERFGCRVDPHSSVVKMPGALTRQVVAKMRQDYQRPDRPERMPVRFSHVRFRPTPYQVHPDFTVSTGGFCCFLYDLDGCRRPAGREDVLSAIHVVNHLDHIDYTGLPVSDQAVPARHRPVVMAAELAKWTHKIGRIGIGLAFLGLLAAADARAEQAYAKTRGGQKPQPAVRASAHRSDVKIREIVANAHRFASGSLPATDAAWRWGSP